MDHQCDSSSDEKSSDISCLEAVRDVSGSKHSLETASDTDEETDGGGHNQDPKDSDASKTKSSNLIRNLKPADVLLGRGTGPANHKGNIIFREAVEKAKPAYVSTPSRKRKNELVQRVVNDIHERGGRFLKQVSLTSAGQTTVDDAIGPTNVDSIADSAYAYEVVTDAIAFEKTKQAIRYVHYKKEPNENERKRQLKEVEDKSQAVKRFHGESDDPKPATNIDSAGWEAVEARAQKKTRRIETEESLSNRIQSRLEVSRLDAPSIMNTFPHHQSDDRSTLPRGDGMQTRFLPSLLPSQQVSPAMPQDMFPGIVHSSLLGNVLTSAMALSRSSSTPNPLDSRLLQSFSDDELQLVAIQILREIESRKSQRDAPIANILREQQRYQTLIRSADDPLTSLLLGSFNPQHGDRALPDGFNSLSRGNLAQRLFFRSDLATMATSSESPTADVNNSAMNQR